MASVIDTIKAAEAEEMKNTGPVINPEFQDLLDVQESASYDELKEDDPVRGGA